MNSGRAAALAACTLLISSAACAYENFRVAVYCRAQEVQKMADPKWLADSWAAVSREVHVDKIYLETHRDRILIDDATLRPRRSSSPQRGIAVAGGITYTVSEPNRFETFSYSNPEHRKAVQEIAEHTARHFDEFILDDFFFTSTKSEFDVKARGTRSWTDYRLAVMEDAAKNLVIGPAKRVNPQVKVVIKYPNWYDHFPALGFNLARGPQLFDGIYTGTETRDAVRSAQHLQPYLSYNIMRYFGNISPGRNGGGWVDTGGATYYDRYAEQLWLTLFARAAPEITLFDIRQMLYPLDPKKSSPRQMTPTSFNFRKVIEPLEGADGAAFTPAHYARVAGVSFEAVDGLLGKLGKPLGVKSYKPYNSSGEDFLQNFIGMAGIPVEMVPAFPTDEAVVLLTAQAAADKDIVSLDRSAAAGRTECRDHFRAAEGTAGARPGAHRRARGLGARGAGESLHRRTRRARVERHAHTDSTGHLSHQRLLGAGLGRGRRQRLADPARRGLSRGPTAGADDSGEFLGPVQLPGAGAQCHPSRGGGLLARETRGAGQGEPVRVRQRRLHRAQLPR